MNATTVAVDLAKSVFFALTNKLARIRYVVLKYHEPYGSPTRRRRTRRRTVRPTPWRLKGVMAFAKRLITHHGSNDCIITD